MRAVVVSLILSCPLAARADDPPADDKARAAEVLAASKVRAASYQLAVEGERARVTFHPEPVLAWTNPIRGTVFGYAFVWTAEGIPVAAGTFVKWYHPYTHRTDELQSLALASLSAEQGGSMVWETKSPGLVLSPIPGAPRPGASATVRLAQMRELAREFSGREVDENGSAREIRLLRKPLYRYERPSGDVIDGALFALVDATDPEVLLLIDARKVSGAPVWQYGLARMTMVHLTVSHRGKEVWDSPGVTGAQVFSHREPYTKFHP